MLQQVRSAIIVEMACSVVFIQLLFYRANCVKIFSEKDKTRNMINFNDMNTMKKAMCENNWK